MSEAIKDDSVMVVGGLMVKFYGRITALCFESFSTNQGTFLQGNFYSPDIPTQTELKRNFLDGVNRPALSGGEWILMRDIPYAFGDYASVTVNAKKKAENLPSSIPDRIGDLGLDRESFLLHRNERYSTSVGYFSGI